MLWGAIHVVAASRPRSEGGTSPLQISQILMRCSCLLATARSLLQGGRAQLLHIQWLRVHGCDGALPEVRVRQGAPAANTQMPHVQLDCIRSVASFAGGIALCRGSQCKGYVELAQCEIASAVLQEFEFDSPVKILDKLLHAMCKL